MTKACTFSPGSTAAHSAGKHIVPHRFPPIKHTGFIFSPIPERTFTFVIALQKTLSNPCSPGFRGMYYFTFTTFLKPFRRFS